MEGERHMNFRFRIFFPVVVFLMTGFLATAALAQEVFEDPDGEYSVTLPAGWIAVVSRDALGKSEVNIVFKVRENGSLKLRRVADADPNISAMDFAKLDEGNTVRFQPGYDRTNLENFVVGAGRSGALLSYDYKNSAGQPFTGRTNYLRMDPKTICVLKFTGRKTILGTLRNQTDSIARSLKLKQQ